MGFLSQSVAFGLLGVTSNPLRISSPLLAARTAPPILAIVFLTPGTFKTAPATPSFTNGSGLIISKDSISVGVKVSLQL